MTSQSARKYLFLFAHPDDDVLIAGTMRMLLTRGAEINAAWVTSGDFLGQATIRQRELARATEILGLESARVHLLGFPTLKLLSDLSQCVERVQRLMEETEPEQVFVTAFEGGHPDHDATNFMAYEANRRWHGGAKLFEFPLYNGTGSAWHWWWRVNAFPDGGPAVLYNRLDEDAVRCKHMMMSTYSSQWMYMIPARLASSHRRMKEIGEPYRPCPADRDHAIPPHDGRLNYERWFSVFLRCHFPKFRAAVLEARR